jgi:uncharacterized membrane protein
MDDLKAALHYDEATEVINMLQGFTEVIGVTKDPQLLGAVYNSGT